MGGAGAIWLVLSTLTQVGAEAALRIENRGGERPIGPTGPREAVVEVEVTPSVAVLAKATGLLSELRYRPRIFARLTQELHRPLVLHQVEAEHRHTFARGWEWDLFGRFSQGDVDYGTFAIDASDPAPLPTLPDAETVAYTTVLGGTGITRRLGRRERLRFRVEALHTRPDLEARTFPELTRGSFEPAFLYAVSRRDELELLISAEQQRFSTGRRFTEFTPQAVWRRRFSERTEGSARLGLLIVHRRASQGGDASGGDMADSVESRTSLLPRGEVTLFSRVYRDQNVRIGCRFALGIQGFADPVAATFDPRLLTSAEVVFEVPSDRLEMRIRGALFTAATREPRFFDESDETTPRDETLVSASLPITHRITDDLSIESGLRVISRAPHLSYDNFAFGRTEIIAYFALNVVFDTMR